MKKILLSLAIMMMAFVSAYAQVPTVMMYQVQIKHGKAAAQNVTVEMQLRNSQNGPSVWSQTFELKDVKNSSVQNLGLDFGDKINFSTGEYWLATIVDGKEMGCAKLTSVPYAIVAKTLEGVLTSDELVGKWSGKAEYKDEYETEYYNYEFKNDGTFTYTYRRYFKQELEKSSDGSGTWKLNGAGSLYVNGVVDGDEEENVVSTYYDREKKRLTFGAGDSAFFGDQTTVTKQNDTTAK